MVSELQSRLLPSSPGLGRDCQWHCLNIFQPHYKVEEVTLQLFPLHPALLQTAVNSQMNTWDLDDSVIQVNDLGIQVNKSEMSETFSFIPTSG